MLLFGSVVIMIGSCSLSWFLRTLFLVTMCKRMVCSIAFFDSCNGWCQITVVEMKKNVEHLYHVYGELDRKQFRLHALDLTWLAADYKKCA